MLSLTTISAGCSLSGKAGAPPLTVQVTAACERILTTVDAPAMKAGDSALLALANVRRTLGIANSRIVKGRSCIANVRQKYAGPGP